MNSTDTPTTDVIIPSGGMALVVDDSTVDRHLAGAIVGKMEGWTVQYASNGVEALEVMKQQLPDVVLTDMLMPQMGGLELVHTIRTDYPLVPVILMTAHGSEEIAMEALRRGAASYVPKRVLAQFLPETLDKILAASRAKTSQKRILDRIKRVDVDFELDNDTSLIAPLVSYLEEAISLVRLCEPSGLILLGVALHEALTNAIFHGNLGMESVLKETDEKAYQRLAAERRAKKPYADRKVYVSAKLSGDEGVFIVRDDGEGFDPNQLPDPTDPRNLDKVHGRGLLLIQTFMDRIEHNPRGNEIRMFKHGLGGEQ
jgi:CheY-like chemotaxis protein